MAKSVAQRSREYRLRRKAREAAAGLAGPAGQARVSVPVALKAPAANVDGIEFQIRLLFGTKTPPSCSS
jgi:hypothetical protein